MLSIGDTGWTGCFLHSKEGVTQREPLDMILYGIVIIPLTGYIQESHLGVLQPWYYDDAGYRGP